MVCFIISTLVTIRLLHTAVRRFCALVEWLPLNPGFFFSVGTYLRRGDLSWAQKNSERLSHIVVALCSWVDGRSKAALIYLPQCFRFKKWKLFEKIASL